MKQIGKIVRQVNQNKPLKLNLNRLVTKQSLGYVLSGLKNNKSCYELSLVECQLEDDDLGKICFRLSDDTAITSLKIGQNLFQNMDAFVDLL